MDIISALDNKRSVLTTKKNESRKDSLTENSKNLKSEGKKKTLKVKPERSPEEIKAKIEEHKNGKTSTKEKADYKPISDMSDDFHEIQKKGEDAKRFLAQKKQAEIDAKAEEGSKTDAPSEVKKSGIRKNDPNDPATVGKLKDLLSKGGFKFSERERETLSKILN